MVASIFIMIVFLVATFAITRVIVATRLHRERLRHEVTMRQHFDTGSKLDLNLPKTRELAEYAVEHNLVKVNSEHKHLNADDRVWAMTHSLFSSDERYVKIEKTIKTHKMNVESKSVKPKKLTFRKEYVHAVQDHWGSRTATVITESGNRYRVSYNQMSELQGMYDQHGMYCYVRGSEVFFRGSDGRGSDNFPMNW